MLFRSGSPTFKPSSDSRVLVSSSDLLILCRPAASLGFLEVRFHHSRLSSSQSAFIIIGPSFLSDFLSLSPSCKVSPLPFHSSLGFCFASLPWLLWIESPRVRTWWGTTILGPCLLRGRLRILLEMIPNMFLLDRIIPILKSRMINQLPRTFLGLSLRDLSCRRQPSAN